MRLIRLDKLIKRSRGRHRRRRLDPERRWKWGGAIAAVVVLAWLSNMPASSPPTGASRTVVADAGFAEDPEAGDFVADETLEEFVDPEHLEAVPVGPGRVAKPVGAVLYSARVIETLGESGIPDVALRAYKQAAARLAATDPPCGVPWTLLAAIGRVESNHGRFGGVDLRADGYGTMRIRGIPLDGRPNVVLIRDTDGGALDGDTTYDRAVGPMQFIPSTWRLVNADGNGDGRADPNNIFDATLGAAVYLCYGSSDLRDPGQAAQAVRRYNNADEYVRVVLDLARMYQTGRVVAVPAFTGSQPDDRQGTIRPPAIPWPWTSRPAETPSVPRTTATVEPPTVLVPTTLEPPQAVPAKPRATVPAKPRVTVPAKPRPSAPVETSRPDERPPVTPPAPGKPTPAPSTDAPAPSRPTSPPVETTTPEPPQETPQPEPSEQTPEPQPSQTTEPDPSQEPTPAEPEPSEDTTPAPSAESPDAAAVGWAPAMRKEVVRILKESAASKPAASPKRAAPPKPAASPKPDASAESAASPEPAACPGNPAAGQPKPSADCGRQGTSSSTPRPSRTR